MRERWRAGVAMVMVLGLTACANGNVFSLEPGTCFDDVVELTDEGGGEVGEVPVVDCDQPHDNEVFATFDLEAEAFPGDERVLELAFDGCLDRFEEYVGSDPEASRYALTHLVPTERTWEVNDDREVVCFLYDRELPELEGSAEGSGA